MGARLPVHGGDPVAVDQEQLDIEVIVGERGVEALVDPRHAGPARPAPMIADIGCEARRGRLDVVAIMGIHESIDEGPLLVGGHGPVSVTTTEPVYGRSVCSAIYEHASRLRLATLASCTNLLG